MIFEFYDTPFCVYILQVTKVPFLLSLFSLLEDLLQ